MRSSILMERVEPGFELIDMVAERRSTGVAALWQPAEVPAEGEDGSVDVRPRTARSPPPRPDVPWKSCAIGPSGAPRLAVRLPYRPCGGGFASSRATATGRSDSARPPAEPVKGLIIRSLAGSDGAALV